MIKSVKIENYKSIQSLELDVGRFNVIIGENGAGKSNFLEALVLFGAAKDLKVNNEFLVSRGIRVTTKQLMLSQYILSDLTKIKIELITDTKLTYTTTLEQQKTPYSEWIVGSWGIFPEPHNDTDIVIQDKKQRQAYANQQYLRIKKSSIGDMANFLLYSPENTALRNFYREGQIEPLGINGEGLLKLLKVMQDSEQEAFADVLTCLELFDWFEQIDVPKDLTSLEDKVNIKDKYLSVMFDQRSANEGFLFVLFYAALFCSQYTPKIFAIDNIDASFNPKLCTAIIKKLVELAKKYDKQVFVTTHNPAILDGIDLGDEEQKILVASRNKQGHTRFKALTLADKPKSSTGEPIRLSEAFLRGYLGGLPKNF